MIHGPLNNPTLKNVSAKLIYRQIIEANYSSSFDLIFTFFFDEFDETNMKILIQNMSSQKFRFQPIKLLISRLYKVSLFKISNSFVKKSLI